MICAIIVQPCSTPHIRHLPLPNQSLIMFYTENKIMDEENKLTAHQIMLSNTIYRLIAAFCCSETDIPCCTMISHTAGILLSLHHG